MTQWTILKDDYECRLNSYNSFDYSSLGQQKMSYLSLIFAYLELFRYKMYSYPIVLIDDISGELDETRWTCLIHFLERQMFQVLITTANVNFKQALRKITHIKMLNVKSGNLVENPTN